MNQNDKDQVVRIIDHIYGILNLLDKGYQFENKELQNVFESLVVYVNAVENNLEQCDELISALKKELQFEKDANVLLQKVIKSYGSSKLPPVEN